LKALVREAVALNTTAKAGKAAKKKG